MWRAWVGLAAATALPLVVACSWCECFPGVYPFDGATDVDPEGPFEVVAGGFWDPEMVALAGVVRLENADGDWLDATVELVDAATLHVWPEQPLEPGEYSLDVVHADALEEGTSGHYVDASYGPSGELTVRFSVGGEPRLLKWFVPRDADTALEVLAFSAPIDASTLEGRVLIDGEPVSVEPLGSTGRVFSLPAAEQTEELPSLELVEGVRTQSGDAVPPTDMVREQDFVERFTGQPWCDC